MCDMAHLYVRHDVFICAKWRIYMCDMTHAFVWHDSFIRQHDSIICATWLMHMCDMTHLYVQQGTFTCATWIIHVRDMTHSKVWHNSIICAVWCTLPTSIRVTWLTHTCSMTRSHVWRDSFICATCLIHMCNMTHSRFLHMRITNSSNPYTPANIWYTRRLYTQVCRALSTPPSINRFSARSHSLRARVYFPSICLAPALSSIPHVYKVFWLKLWELFFVYNPDVFWNAILWLDWTGLICWWTGLICGLKRHSHSILISALLCATTYTPSRILSLAQLVRFFSVSLYGCLSRALTRSIPSVHNTLGCLRICVGD